MGLLISQESHPENKRDHETRSQGDPPLGLTPRPPSGATIEKKISHSKTDFHDPLERLPRVCRAPPL